MNKDSFIEQWNMLADVDKTPVREIYTICGNEFEADRYKAYDDEAMLYLHDYPSGRIQYDTIRRMI